MSRYTRQYYASGSSHMFPIDAIVLRDISSELHA